MFSFQAEEITLKLKEKKKKKDEKQLLLRALCVSLQTLLQEANSSQNALLVCPVAFGLRVQ